MKEYKTATLFETAFEENAVSDLRRPPRIFVWEGRLTKWGGGGTERLTEWAACFNWERQIAGGAKIGWRVALPGLPRKSQLFFLGCETHVKGCDQPGEASKSSKLRRSTRLIGGKCKQISCIGGESSSRNDTWSKKMMYRVSISLGS